MRSPLVSAVHMNTRYIETSKTWFGGGADLNPMIENDEDNQEFHQALLLLFAVETTGLFLGVCLVLGMSTDPFP
jgi:coproporphyrinogen III oxidase